MRHCNLANPVAARARRLDSFVAMAASGSWEGNLEYPASKLEFPPETAPLG